jgi:hypothetical protein
VPYGKKNLQGKLGVRRFEIQKQGELVKLKELRK